MALAANFILPLVVADPITTYSKPTFTEKPRNRISMAASWALAHTLLGLVMFCSVFIRNWIGTLVLVSLAGVAWAIALWVPFAIIGSEIAGRHEHIGDLLAGDLDPMRQDQAGTIIGLHNSVISATQLIAVTMSSVVFWQAERLGIEDGTGWVLGACGCAALIAAVLASRFER